MWPTLPLEEFSFGHGIASTRPIGKSTPLMRPLHFSVWMGSKSIHLSTIRAPMLTQQRCTIHPRQSARKKERFFKMLMRTLQWNDGNLPKYFWLHLDDLVGERQLLHSFQAHSQHTKRQSPRRCKTHWRFVGISQASMKDHQFGFGHLNSLDLWRVYDWLNVQYWSHQIDHAKWEMWNVKREENVSSVRMRVRLRVYDENDDRKKAKFVCEWVVHTQIQFYLRIAMKKATECWEVAKKK